MIGRGPRCDCRLEPLFISTTHCKIMRVQDGKSGDVTVMLEDLSSTGSYVNGLLVGRGKRNVLTHMAEVSFGIDPRQAKEKCTFVYRFMGALLTPVSASLYVPRGQTAVLCTLLQMTRRAPLTFRCCSGRAVYMTSTSLKTFLGLARLRRSSWASNGRRAAAAPSRSSTSARSTCSRRWPRHSAAKLRF